MSRSCFVIARKDVVANKDVADFGAGSSQSGIQQFLANASLAKIL